MEMNQNFRSEAHVAQKSRRDKLRIQQDHLYHQTHHGLPAYNAHKLHHLPAQDGINFSAPLGNMRYDPSQLCSDMNTFSVNSSQAASSLMCKESEKRVILDPSFGNFSGTIPNHGGDPQHCNSTWKSIGGSRSASESSWLANNHQNQFFLGDGSSSSPSLRIINSNNIPMDVNVHQNMQCESLPANQNAFEVLATPSHVRSFGLEADSFKPKNTDDDQQAEPRQVNWILGPAYTNQSFLQGSSNQWNGGRDHHRLVSNHENYVHSNTQALCLTLSSVPSPKVHATHQIADHEASAVVNIPGNISQHNPGPLGPFTGYATILETSMFLRPAQQLLDEICCVGCPKIMETSCEVLSDKIFEESGGPNDAAEHAGTSNSMDSYQPDNVQKKAKLVYMQEEVCKRYKHYHQQMQLVVSSFESVSALSAATPYISLALRTVSKHFRNLKNAIANQLKTLKNALGEDYLSSSKGQYSGSSSMLKFSEHGFQKGKSSGNMGIMENQHVWRPQRGLPEHAVAVLRAWLFDHFLHPYPTDTDKHMLAAQTGLTRNQVSNWFINARVRVWKPMVEEVHMLETKGMSETGHDPDKPNNTRSTPDPPRNNNSSQRLNMNSQTTTLPNSNMWKNQEKRSRTEYDHHVHHNNVPTCNFDGSILGNLVSNSHHSGIEMGGLGSVSLTLGLRQSAENGQRHHEHHRRPCFGGQIIRDFVG